MRNWMTIAALSMGLAVAPACGDDGGDGGDGADTTVGVDCGVVTEDVVEGVEWRVAFKSDVALALAGGANDRDRTTCLQDGGETHGRHGRDASDGWCVVG